MANEAMSLNNLTTKFHEDLKPATEPDSLGHEPAGQAGSAGPRDADENKTTGAIAVPISVRAPPISVAARMRTLNPRRDDSLTAR